MSQHLRKSNPPQAVKTPKFWQKCNFLLLFSFLISTLFLLVCTKSSPLYPMNDWVDVNCFFTMGKSILHGIVPYAELYEQKGPVLYFMYAIAALISDQSFFGVFLPSVCFCISAVRLRKSIWASPRWCISSSYS